MRKVSHNGSFCSPAVIFECPTQGEGCTIGRYKSVALCKHVKLGDEHVGVPAAQLLGQLFLAGTEMEGVKKAVRNCDMTISNEKCCVGKKFFFV